MVEPLWTLTACALTAGYRDGTLTPTAAVESVLNRLAAVNPLLNAVVTVDADGARMAARESALRHRNGAALSPLDGIPITVKDNIPVKGMRSTWGSRLYADKIPEADELPIARLRAAGAIILGKTNCPEFTVQGYTDNRLFGVTGNPWNLALTSGGSSGGAVSAVAAGIGPIAIGTDGGGSIRRPASHTGLVGLKPSRGRVPRCDGFPPILLDFEVIGPMTRTVADLELAMAVMSPADSRDPNSAPFAGKPLKRDGIKPCRILYIPRFGTGPVDPEIAAAVDAAAVQLADLGHNICMGTVPFDQAALDAAWPVIGQSGLAWLVGQDEDTLAELTPSLREMVTAGHRYTAAQYVEALMATRQVERDVLAVFDSHDLILTPSAAALPWPAAEPFPPVIAGQPVGGRGHALFTNFVNIAGCPGLNLPCRPSKSGLPIGIQLVAAPGADGLLLAVAAQCEEAGLWTTTVPGQMPNLEAALGVRV